MIFITLLSVLVAGTFFSAPVFAQEEISGPSPDLQDGLDMNVERADINNPNVNKINGSILLNVTISGQVEKDTYPEIYPVSVTYYEEKATGSDEKIGSDVVELNPTRSKVYTPRTGTIFDDYTVVSEFQARLTFLQNSTQERDIRIEADSRKTSDDVEKTNSFTIQGENDASSVVSSNRIVSREDIDQPESVLYVDNFRATTDRDEERFLEDFTIPYGNLNLSGEVKNFVNARAPNNRGAQLTADQNNFSMVTLTESVERSEPQSLVVTYEIEGGGPIEVTPIDSAGKEISTNTSYQLAEDPSTSENCQSVSQSGGEDQNFCVFTFDSEELDRINELREMYLQYEGSNDTVANLQCQSLISGYLASDEIACGGSGASMLSENFFFLTFEGKNTGGSYDSPVQLTDNVDSSGETTLDLRATADANIPDDSTGDVDVFMLKKSEAQFGNGNLTTFDDSDAFAQFSASLGDSVKSFETSLDGTPDELSSGTYIAVMCRPGEECDLDENNLDIITLTVKGPSPGDVNLVLDTPIRLQVDPIDSETRNVKSGTETIRTTDPNYNTNNNLDTVDDYDSSDKETITDDFSGTVVEETVVRNATRSSSSSISQMINNYRYDAYQNTSSDIDSANDVSDTSADLVNSNILYRTKAQEPTPTSEWSESPNPSGTPKQMDYTTEYFDIMDYSDVRNVYNRGENWYVNREATIQEADNTDLETRVGHSDPDECLNCLPLENVSQDRSQIENRLNSSPIGAIVSSPDGVQLWELIGTDTTAPGIEPQGISRNTGNYTDVQTYLTTTTSISGVDTLIRYNNRNSMIDDIENRYRVANIESEEVPQWRLKSNNYEVQFKKPITESVYQYEKQNYDITYVFESYEEDETLYEYERNVYDTIVQEYESKNATVDVSDSYARNTELDRYTIKFEGYDTAIEIPWEDGVQNVPVDERTCSGTVEQDTITTETGDIYVDSCRSGGEMKHVMEVKKEYFDPGFYTEDVTLYGEQGATDEGTLRVNVNEGDSRPEFDVEPINDKVDMRMERVPFKIDIESPSDGEENLGSNWRLEVSPAGTVDTVYECPAGYSEAQTTEHESSTTVSDSYRMKSQCVANNVENPRELTGSDRSVNFDIIETSKEVDLARDEFFLFAERDNTLLGESERVYGESVGEGIPSSAFGECERQGMVESSTGTCISDAEDSFQDTDAQIDISSNQFSTKLSAEKYGNRCPADYTKNIDTESSAGGEINTKIVTCELTKEPIFDLRTRSEQVDYTEVTNDAITDCSDVPTSSEEGSHSGYENYNDGGDRKCQLVDSDDPGPEQFTLVEDFNNGEIQPSDIRDIPRGAVRGSTLQTVVDGGSDVCDSETITEDNQFSCEITVDDPTDTGQTTTTLDYANYNILDFVSEQDAVSVDNQDAKKEVWSRSYVPNGEETVTAFVNPRSNNVFDPGTQEFTFTLKSDRSDIGAVESKTVNVELCRAQAIDSLSDLPVETKQDSECDQMDTIYNDIEDIDTTKTDKDVESYASGESTEITTTQFDACPYTQRFPRDEPPVLDSSDLDAQPGQATQAEVQYDVMKTLASYYSLKEDPCRDDKKTQRVYAPNTDPQNQITDVWDNATKQVNTRYVRQEHLQNRTNSNAEQAGWQETQSDQGIFMNPELQRGYLRLGTPLTRSRDSTPVASGPIEAEYADKVTRDLVTAYSFDNLDSDRTVGGSGANTHMIQDVYANEDVPAYHGRLWYSSACYDINSELSQTGFTPMPVTSADSIFGDRVMMYNGPDGRNCNYISETTWDNNVNKFEYGAVTTDSSLNEYEQVIDDSDLVLSPHTLHANNDFIKSGRLAESPLNTFEEEGYSNGNPGFNDSIPTMPNADLYNNYDPTVTASFGDNLDSEELGVYNNYAEGEGMYGSTALLLDDFSWVAMTPFDTNTSADGVAGNPMDDGGFKSMYSSHDDTNIDVNDLSNRLRQSNNGWSISFWIKPQTRPGFHGYDDAWDKNSRGILGITGQDGSNRAQLHYRTDLTSGGETCSNTGSSSDTNLDEETIEEEITYGWNPAGMDCNFGADRPDSLSPRSEWDHVAISYDGASRIDLSINGDNTGWLDVDQVGIDPEIENGDIMSLGAIFDSRPSTNYYNNNRRKGIVSQSQKMYVDNVRVYDRGNITFDAGVRNANLESTAKLLANVQDSDINPAKPDSSTTLGENSIYGTITSVPHDIDDQQLNESIEMGIPSSAVSEENNAFDLEVIPCEEVSGDVECYPSESKTAFDNHYPNQEFNYETRSIDNFTNAESKFVGSDVTHVQFKATLKSERDSSGPIDVPIHYAISSTPVLGNNISIDSSGGGGYYESCQDLGLSYSDAYGNENIEATIFAGGNIGTVNCDMETETGGWTPFGSFNDGSDIVTTYIDDTDGVFTDQSIDSCEFGETNCFASAQLNDSDIPQSVNDEFTNPKPQVMIKSKTEGSPDRWAIFELTHKQPYRNYNPNDSEPGLTLTSDHENLLPNKTIEALSGMERTFNASTDTSETIFMEPIATRNIDINQRAFAVEKIAHESLADGGARFVMENGQQDVDIANIQISEDQTVETANCLNQDSDTCEFYYRHDNALADHKNSSINSYLDLPLDDDLEA